MDILGHLARAFDAKEYRHDNNPENWRTISGAHVHLDGNGNIDGGAGGKFNGRSAKGKTTPQAAKDPLAGLAAATTPAAKKKSAAKKPKWQPADPKTYPAYPAAEEFSGTKIGKALNSWPEFSYLDAAGKKEALTLMQAGQQLGLAWETFKWNPTEENFAKVKQHAEVFWGADRDGQPREVARHTFNDLGGRFNQASLIVANIKGDNVDYKKAVELSRDKWLGRCAMNELPEGVKSSKGFVYPDGSRKKPEKASSLPMEPDEEIDPAEYFASKKKSTHDTLAVLARAFDTKGYPDDKDPNHWFTMNGSPVHTDGNGNIDGGVGGKFNKKQVTTKKAANANTPAPAAQDPLTSLANATEPQNNDLQAGTTSANVSQNKGKNVKVEEWARGNDPFIPKLAKLVNVKKKAGMTQDDFAKAISTELSERNKKYGSLTLQQVANQDTFGLHKELMKVPERYLNPLLDNDKGTQRLGMALGLNGTPKVLSKEQFTAEAKKTPHPIIHRGIQSIEGPDMSAKMLSDDLKYGDVTWRGGTACAWGVGIYFATDSTFALGYAGWEKNVKRGDGTVVNAFISKDAKVIEWDDLVEEGKKRGVSISYTGGGDTDVASMLAMQLGYQVIKVNGGGGHTKGAKSNLNGLHGDFYNVLDRSCLVVQKEDN